MTARTPNDVLKARVGDLMFEVATLTSTNESLQDKIVELGRMLPPETFEALRQEAMKNESLPVPPQPVPVESSGD